VRELRKIFQRFYRAGRRAAHRGGPGSACSSCATSCGATAAASRRSRRARVRAAASCHPARRAPMTRPGRRRRALAKGSVQPGAEGHEVVVASDGSAALATRGTRLRPRAARSDAAGHRVSRCAPRARPVCVPVS
jgi:hypothetical protein